MVVRQTMYICMRQGYDAVEYTLESTDMTKWGWPCVGKQEVEFTVPEHSIPLNQLCLEGV